MRDAEIYNEDPRFSLSTFSDIFDMNPATNFILAAGTKTVYGTGHKEHMSIVDYFDHLDYLHGKVKGFNLTLVNPFPRWSQNSTRREIHKKITIYNKSGMRMKDNCHKDSAWPKFKCCLLYTSDAADE